MKQSNLNYALLILRIMAGFSMLLHGIDKMTNGIEGLMNMLTDKGIPSFFSYGVYIGEVLAPLLIIIGYRTKLSALVLALTMLIAVLLVHSSEIFALSEHGGWAIELQGFYFFVSIVLLLTGGGKYAVSKKHKWD